MPVSFSIYLDLLRFLAALAVFLAHLGSFPFSKNVLWAPLAAYGDIAVTLFFLMSGYVISYVSARRENHPEAYFGSRLSRLYSIIVIALPLTFLFDAAGQFLNPAFYVLPKVLAKPESWAGYLSALFFVNEYQVFGFHGISPGSNAPYWSLSFEATYYLVAGLALFSRRAFWIPASVLILVLAGRTVIALFPVWILGFLLYRVKAGAARRSGMALAGFGVSALLLACLPLIERHLPSSASRVFLPWGRLELNRDIVADYFIAAVFAWHLLCARGVLSAGCAPLDRLKSGIRWLGSLTFPLYLFHYPALCFFSAISPWPATSPWRVLFVATLSGALAIVLTPLCERLKTSIRQKFILADFMHPTLLGAFSRYAKRAPLGR
ncbi:acyltransferase [Janthinobacterium sp.]|uniref:acyltransferase family protein n=1 Tax=Janthinobacterium sp. TaxID=1871054 RepID=UPI00293D90B0|nr:acyltransferase [Janthinobacterium sp.]